MHKINCFMEECRFNYNMKCNAPKVAMKLGCSRDAAEKAICEQFRPVPYTGFMPDSGTYFEEVSTNSYMY